MDKKIPKQRLYGDKYEVGHSLEHILRDRGDPTQRRLAGDTRRLL